ncbi:MAG: hypothetical protein OXD30_03495, partial [Bryobacterales bacterium]|nr:hypothetical protein [Bryobacterales bacterium]
SLEAWQRCEGVADRAGFPVWGIDLGTSAAMSAATAYWPPTGALAALAAFPENPSLEERGLRDGVGRLYAECERRHELIQAGSHAVDIEALLIAALDRFGAPSRIVADRWREAELRDAMQRAGVRAPLELRGQGFKDGGEDVRDFRKACLTGQVVAAPSMLLRAALGEAMVVRDPAGNEKLAKACEGGRRARARDDAAAATILAVATGIRMARRPQPRRSQWVYA